MNALQRYILDNALDEVLTMDRLQLESRTISDECVWAADVAPADCRRAVEWLRVQEARAQ